MTSKEFITYVNEQRRQGRSDSEIARGLRLSLVEFLGKVNEAEEALGGYIFGRAAASSKSTTVVRERTKPVSGFGDPEAVKSAFQAAEQKKREKKAKVKKTNPNEVTVAKSLQDILKENEGATESVEQVEEEKPVEPEVVTEDGSSDDGWME